MKRRLASWSFRLEVESLRWSKQFFVTLTYDTDHVPITKNGFMTLRPRDVTLFLKRVRKKIGTIKYYYCGEYGSKNFRPHYHLILFANNGRELDIAGLWPHGNTHFGRVEAGSIRYTIQYFDKGQFKRSHDRDDRVAEFSRMSNGIGRDWLTPEMVRHLLEHPEKGFIYDHEGRKIALPRYYKRRLFDYVGSDSLVATHPSILVHRDNMLLEKKEHHEAIAKVMEEKFPPVELTEKDWEARASYIENYRKSKRKVRK